MDDLEYDLTLTARDLDLMALIPAKSRQEGPLSPLNFTADISGKGIDPDTLWASLDLELDAVHFQDWDVRQALLSARLEDGVVSLDSARVDTPYGQVSAAGRLELAGAIDAQVQAAVSDLKPLGAKLKQPIQGGINAHEGGSTGSCSSSKLSPRTTTFPPTGRPPPCGKTACTWNSRRWEAEMPDDITDRNQMSSPASNDDQSSMWGGSAT